ncbi:hypothetical protein AALO_G00001030 [Alosa alosa]|uniref:Uncharacterized protein n=1 Tax=Alosa alosa TaxID=278164 RepID=A0AAV6HID1_9TELE|nr:hypothetical protein AALO_G00001030 [Alosa alosa]
MPTLPPTERTSVDGLLPPCLTRGERRGQRRSRARRGYGVKSATGRGVFQTPFHCDSLFISTLESLGLLSQQLLLSVVGVFFFYLFYCLLNASQVPDSTSSCLPGLT